MERRVARPPDWEASYQQIVRLKEEGKVLHWGISINDHAPDTALRILADPLFETAQVIYNIYDRSPEKALFALAKKSRSHHRARAVDEGALTGQITAKTVFPAGDWRAQYFAGDRKARRSEEEGAGTGVGRPGRDIARARAAILPVDTGGLDRHCGNAPAGARASERDGVDEGRAAGRDAIEAEAPRVGQELVRD